MEIIRFDNPYILYGLALLPLLIIVHYLINRQKRKQLGAFADPELYSYLAPKASKSRRNWKHALFITALAFLILALANPQIGSRMEKSTRKGVDLVIAIDVSNSMLAKDIEPNRLENAKHSVDRLIQTLEGDRIGLVIFAGNAYKQLPITTDYSAARMFLRAISTDIVPTQGTAIGEAIEQSLTSFDEESDHNKAIILISDGENHQ
ncbi:MAG: VWA domain-containing protein, partial [Bacteroidales bacterium]